MAGHGGVAQTDNRAVLWGFSHQIDKQTILDNYIKGQGCGL